MAMAKDTSGRRRAPRRDGERTTLRVPRELAQQAQELAAFLGTTSNDALVLMATRGAVSYVQELQMARAEKHQLAAIIDAVGPLDQDAEFLSDEEAREAVLLLRSGRFGPVV